jgi:hypothetical protein
MAAPRGSKLRDVIDEFARVLDVLGGQLSDSMQEAERECAAVGRAFATAKGRIDAIVLNQPACTSVGPDSSEVGAALDAAVVGLQYHDRLAQRIGHIRAGLHQLQEMLLDGTERSRSDWLQLLRGVEKSHRLQQERLMAAGTESNGSAELF